MLTISSIPPFLAAEEKRYFGFSSIGQPSDINIWRGLIRSFIAHLLEKYGASRINTWKITLFYLPAYSVPEFRSEKDYYNRLDLILTLYQETYTVIRSLCPSMEIGCPEGDLNELLEPEEKLSRIFRFFAEKQCQPDFFPFHDCWNISDQIQNDGKDQIRDWHICVAESTKLIETLRNHIENLIPGGLPLWCVSWYCIPGHNPINETMLAPATFAAYVLQNFHNLHRIGITVYGFTSVPSDEGSKEFDGTHALLTRSHIRRPFYYALSEMKKIPSGIVYTDSPVLAALDQDTLTIFLVNAADFSYRTKQSLTLAGKLPVSIPPEHYYFPGSDRPLLTDIRQTNRTIGGNARNFSADIFGLPSGRYLLQQTVINTDHGNAYDEWIREGAYEHLSPGDCREINFRALPARLKKEIIIQNGAYRLTCSLAPNEIRILRFQRLA